MSVALGQERLLEDPPDTSLIVPFSNLAHWGIDPSTQRSSIAWVDGFGQRGVQTVSYPPAGPRRLTEIRERTIEEVRLICHREGRRPGVVVVEQPGGKSVNVQLMFAVGVIVEALQEGLRQAFNFDFQPQLQIVVPSKWKKVVLGRGDVYKPKRDDHRPYYTLTWAQEQGYEGKLWDEADAYAIAEYARKSYGFIVR